MLRAISGWLAGGNANDPPSDHRREPVAAQQGQKRKRERAFTSSPARRGSRPNYAAHSFYGETPRRSAGGSATATQTITQKLPPRKIRAIGTPVQDNLPAAPSPKTAPAKIIKSAPTEARPRRYSSPSQVQVQPAPIQRMAQRVKKSKFERANWKKTPNVLAQTILTEEGATKSSAQRLIRHDLDDEPLYAFRDAEIRDGLWQVLDQIEHVAWKYGSGEIIKDADVLKQDFTALKPETVKILSCVATGGPGGEQGWHELFTKKLKRRGLVCAVIGNVICQQVYQHPFFGGTEWAQRKLMDIGRKESDSDGFDRKTKYARLLNSLLKHSPYTITLTSDFHTHVCRVVNALLIHLSIFENTMVQACTEVASESISKALYTLVAHAGILSLMMHLNPHTVYYFVPVFKEDTFRREDMECFNEEEMEETHPLDRKTWPAGYTEEDIRRAKGDRALTQICIMDGVTAYRRGGWEEAALSKLEKPVHQQVNGKNTGAQGIRTRVLTHGWTYCCWGRPRVFKNGKPADDPAVHGKQWKGEGFVSFTELEGVSKPVEVEKEAVKGKGKGKQPVE